MQEFQWDDAKYPKTRSIAENLTLMMTTVNKLDEEVRTKMSTLKDTRGTLAALAKDSNNYATADLIDVLTPKNTKAEDFVETEHLTTVVIVVPKDQTKDFLAAYETIDNFVVPETALQLNVAPDKDGATLWRVVLFKKSVPMFKQAIGGPDVAKGGKRFLMRDFTFSAESHKEYEARRSALVKDAEKQETMGKMVCKAAFADMFLSWVHIKAMRTFVESVLRYGVGNQGTPNFMAFMLKVPSQARQQQGLRSALSELVGAKGQSHEDEGEDFYPYVSLAMQPLSQD
jgi:V-type H+-transporting ATPase subunit C